MKSSDLATKSVSDLSSTRAATRPSATARATAPSVLARSVRAADLASPFSRSHLEAASKSPLFSTRAFLASIIPAPVAWRRACTSLAVNSAIRGSALLSGLAGGLDHRLVSRRLGGGGRLGLGGGRRGGL